MVVASQLVMRAVTITAIVIVCVCGLAVQRLADQRLPRTLGLLLHAVFQTCIYVLYMYLTTLVGRMGSPVPRARNEIKAPRHVCTPLSRSDVVVPHDRVWQSPQGWLLGPSREEPHRRPGGGDVFPAPWFQALIFRLKWTRVGVSCPPWQGSLKFKAEQRLNGAIEKIKPGLRQTPAERKRIGASKGAGSLGRANTW